MHCGGVLGRFCYYLAVTFEGLQFKLESNLLFNCFSQHPFCLSMGNNIKEKIDWEQMFGNSLGCLQKNQKMKNIRNYPEFTHFACLPYNTKQQRQQIDILQQKIRKIVQTSYQKQSFIESNYKWAHVTLCMLVLHRQDMRNRFQDVFQSIKGELNQILNDTVLTFRRIRYFSKFNPKTKKKDISLIYLEILKNQQYQKVVKASDIFIRAMLKGQIIVNQELKQMRIYYDHNDNLYKNEECHLTLFRVKEVPDNQKFQSVFKEIESAFQPVEWQCRSMDISTRGRYEPSGFYQPFDRVQLKYRQ